MVFQPSRLAVATAWFALVSIALNSSCAVEECPPTTVEVDGRCIDEVVPEGNGTRSTSRSSAMSADEEMEPQDSRGGEGAPCESPQDCFAPATCNEPTLCSGSRPSFGCVEGRCAVQGTQTDDSACGSDIEFDDCGPYKSVFCDGEADQVDTHECPVSCDLDTDCDKGAKCVAGECGEPGTLENGTRCSSDSKCKSGHCANRTCCDAGDCCKTPSDCPANYSKETECTQPASCQGARVDAVCDDNTCSSEMVETDSACTSEVVARRCAESEDVMCTGDGNQVPPPPCMTTTDSPPTPAPAPEPAPDPSSRCDPPDCCMADGDCPSPRSQCMNASSCAGVRITFQCESRRCVQQREDDSMACKGSVVRTCGDSGQIVCNGTTNQVFVCGSRCTDVDQVCAPALKCTRSGLCGPSCRTDAECSDITNEFGDNFVCGDWEIGASAGHCCPESVYCEKR